jgi:hypothetical protein
MRFVSTFIVGVLVSAVGPVMAAQTAAEAPSAENPSTAMARDRAPDTLMFTTDEVNEIQSRVAAGNQAGGRGEGSAEGIENATLYLSTILYFDPQNWTIWINGSPIGPRQDFQEFEVTAIDANSVELVVPLSAQGMRPVRLSPNQTFVAKTGDIVEGPWK